MTLRRAAVAAFLATSLAGPSAAQTVPRLPPDTSAPVAADTVAPSARPDSAALVFRGDTLGFLYGHLSPFTAAERAERVAARIDDLSLAGAGGDDVEVRSVDGRTEVWVADEALLVVTAQDSAGLGLAMAAAADSLAAAVRRGLDTPLVTEGLRGILLGTLYTLLATLALWWLFRLMARWYPRLYRRIRDIQEEKLPTLRFQRLEILSGERIEALIMFAARASRLIVAVLLLFLYFPLVFSFFPPTRVLAQRILALAVEPSRLALQAVVGYLPNLFYIGVIVVLAYYGLKVVRFVFTAVEHGTLRLPGFYQDWAAPTYSLVRVLVVAFAVILIWPYLPNSDSLAFKGVAGFLGLLLTFGSAGAVSNVVGGVVMIYMRPFQIGDRVKIADTVGDVVERGMLVTRLLTPKKVEITIPNSMVLGNFIVNYSATAREGGIILHTTVTLGYDVPWPEVHEAMAEAARRTPGILEDPAPFVLQTALGDYAVSYELNAYTDQPRMMARIYSGLHQNLQDALAEAGIEILSPIYHAVRDGNLSTIPEPHTPPASETPSFRVRTEG